VPYCLEVKCFVEKCFCVTAVVVTENVAVGKPAVQSSTYFSAVASKAVDGDLTTTSCTNMATTDPWWSVDLGSPMSVARVEVTNDVSDYYG